MRFISMEEVHIQSNGSFNSNSNFYDGSVQYKQYVSDTETFFDNLLDRTVVSVMVNESVTKGIVKALSEEANEAISAKDTEIDNLSEKWRSSELELSRLKHNLENRHVENGSLGATSSSRNKQPKESLSVMGDANLSKMDVYLQYLGVGDEKECEEVIRVQVEEKWQKIMTGMADIKMLLACKSANGLNVNNSTVSKPGSFSYTDLIFEAESASCNLNEASASSKLRMVFNKVSEMEEELTSLRDMSDKVFRDIYDDFLLSKSTSIECQWMWTFQEAVNAIVMQDFFQSIQEHSEEELQKRQVISMQHDVWLSQIKAISSLHEELESILQYLFDFESGSLLLHASHEGHDEEANGSKRVQRKVFGDHISLVHQECNASIVSSEESTSGINVSSDAGEVAHLKHMAREELISYFKSEMLKMSRNHESKLHAATEKNFQLKRELFKHAGSLRTQKDKNLDSVKKRILKVIENLDNIMKQNVEFSIIFDDYKICGAVDKLTKENENLKIVLNDKKKEIRLLSSQVIDARQKLARQSSIELSHLKQIRKYKSELEECEMKGFITNDICITVLKELILGHDGVSDSDLATIFSHELGELLLQETVKDADTIMKFAMESYCEAKKLESLAEERGQAISAEMLEKEQLKKEKESFSAFLEVKKKSEMEARSTLSRREEELNIVSEECDTLRHRILQKESLIMDKDNKLATMSGSIGLLQLDKYKNELKVLEQRLKLTLDDLHEVCEQRISLEHAVHEKQQTAFVFLENERKLNKQLEVLSESVLKCLKEMKELERKVVDAISLHNLRFWKLNDTLRSITQQGSLLWNRQLWCKKIFSDLQKAEAEVDILGDEVDSLLNILEKIYFVLDHYSPVLKYYPGIMEMLKLVKQELSGKKLTPSSLASQHELDWKK